MDMLEEARELFKRDKFSTELTGAVIEQVSDGYAKCSLQITPQHRNVIGAIMGGAIFTLADFAFAIASNIGRPLTTSLTSQITFLSASKGNRLEAEAKCVKAGKKFSYFEMNVFDDLGAHIAVMTTTGAVIGDKIS